MFPSIHFGAQLSMYKKAKLKHQDANKIYKMYLKEKHIGLLKVIHLHELQ